MTHLPATHCLSAAILTPVTRELRPDVRRLAAFARDLFAAGVDGLTLFGTTGEGPEFGLRDRIETVEALMAEGVSPGVIFVSAGALAIDDAITLARHSAEVGVAGCLLMPPCMFRGGITDDGVFEYYRQVIERVDHPDLRLYLYNFPDICGVEISPRLVRRLVEKYPGIIAGVKDSGGNPELTRDYILGFAGLKIFTGNEIDVPELNPLGLAGTVCGLANVMPALMRRVVDARNGYEGRPLVAALRDADAILSRFPFIPSAKAVVADQLQDPEWLRLVPPMTPPPTPQRARMVADYARWLATGGTAVAATGAAPSGDNVLPLRSA